MDINVEFRKVIPITKAWEGDDGELYIEGESSGPEIDKDEQFMTSACVKHMSDQVNASPIPINDEHQRRGILNDLGMAIKSEITPELHMKPTGRLDSDNPAAVTLWKKIQKGKQFGFSVAGHVLELAKKTINGKVYKGFNRIRLDHIAVTTKPSWSPSLGTLVAKSLEQDGFDWAGAPEYGGEIFAAVERTGAMGSYALVEGLLDRLEKMFGHRTADESRNAVPLRDIPELKHLFQTGSALVAPSKAYDEEDGEWRNFIQKALPMPSDAKSAEAAEAPSVPGIYDFRQLAEMYERLYNLTDSISRRSKGRADGGKKIVTRLKTAMSAIAESMKQMLTKSEPPKPLVYGKENLVKAEPKKEESMPGEALTSFGQVDAGVGALPVVEKGPQPSVGDQTGGGLTSFQQVADDLEERVTKEQAAAPDAVLEALGPAEGIVGEFGDFVAKVFASDAPLVEKRTVLAEVGKSFFNRLGQMLDAERPEEDRLRDTVMKAIAPLTAKIENLERQLAVAKSQPAAQGGEPEMTRKSLRIGVRPARVVGQQQESPTFEDLVRNPQGGGWPPEQ